MAKFTLYFKDKLIGSHLFESGVVHIGRDETNAIHVDSLAVAPAHAAVVIKDGHCTIKQLNDDFPLIINNEESKEYLLSNDDKIQIGKHHIIYNSPEADNSQLSSDDVAAEPLTQEIQVPAPLNDANLQIMSGDHIGRVLPLKKAMTRLGHTGSGVIVIAKRKEGYFISVLENSDTLSVNNQPLGDNSIKLNNNDIVNIDDASLQFFQD